MGKMRVKATKTTWESNTIPGDEGAMMKNPQGILGNTPQGSLHGWHGAGGGGGGVGQGTSSLEITPGKEQSVLKIEQMILASKDAFQRPPPSDNRKSITDELLNMDTCRIENVKLINNSIVIK